MGIENEQWREDHVDTALFVISLITDFRNAGSSAQEMIESAPRELINESLVVALAWFDSCLACLSQVTEVDYNAFISSFSIGLQSGDIFRRMGVDLENP